MTNETRLRLEWAPVEKWTRATLGDYFLGVLPDIGYAWMWEIATAYMERDKTCEIGFADTRLAAQIAAEAALFKRLAAYQGLATDAELARLRRIEAAARAWHAARDAATSCGNWRPGAPARRYDDACDVLAAVLTATAGGASGDDRAARIETAAREVLASGQAQYDRNLERLPDTEEFALEGRYVGDLVPAAAMIALRAAVEGES